MTAPGKTTGPAVPPALPPRLYCSIFSDVPHLQPQKAPKRSKTQESTSVSDVGSEAIYEDPDALLASNPDVSQPEAKPRPVPRPRSKSKPNLQLDTNNTTKGNYIHTINSGHNDNTAVTGYVTRTAFDANPTQTANSTKTTYETGTTTNANTASKSHNSRKPSSTTSSTVNSTHDAVRTHNANPAKSSDRTGDTKNDASYERMKNFDEYMTPRSARQPPPTPPKTIVGKSTAADSPEIYNMGTNSELATSAKSDQNGKNSNDYMTPRSAYQALLPPLALESKGPYSTAADASQYYTTRTNSNTSVKTRDVKSRHQASSSSQPLMHHSSSMLDLSSVERHQNDYMTPRSARQALLPPSAPESKGPYSTAADASQDYTSRTNSNTRVKNLPPLPPPGLEPNNPQYCDKVNPTPQHRDNRSRHGPQTRVYHSTSMLDMSSETSSETSSLYEMGSHSGSSQYTDIVNPQYTIVLPDDHYNRLWTQAQRYEDDNQSTYNDIYQFTQDNVAELLQWLKIESRQSDTMSLYGLSMEDEMRSFDQQAWHVRKARRLYNLLMKKRKDPLQKILDEFKAICEKLEKVQKANKTMGIAGGTTSAVGGVAAVVGIALAPVTMGASLIATAVGAGIVATSAGGVGVKVATANKKIVNRETVEKLVNAYKSDVADLEHCLNYILCLMKELQRHNIAKLSRAGAHPDALRMAELSKVVSNKSRQVSPNNSGGLTSESMLKQFESEFDEYFTEKKGQKLKKSNKSKFLGRVCTLVKNLQEELNYLDQMWEVLT
ncbi:uncharacterized protein LOC129363932 [Poeciliopsis prolifica]|uniref:uncharacterized protein LOC129363932 n=1 Tax=Poeciliopsis prolifica TaxID=188132 RepID=UPI002412E8BF|nr:uncharacterized protein LOC129363932 [Poeciliopsis prolifica]